MIDTRCQADNPLHWRPGDTPATIDEIVRHNFAYECACAPPALRPVQCTAAADGPTRPAQSR